MLQHANGEMSLMRDQSRMMCDQEGERLEHIRGRFVNEWKDQNEIEGIEMG